MDQATTERLRDELKALCGDSPSLGCLCNALAHHVLTTRTASSIDGACVAVTDPGRIADALQRALVVAVAGFDDKKAQEVLESMPRLRSIANDTPEARAYEQELVGDEGYGP